VLGLFARYDKYENSVRYVLLHAIARHGKAGNPVAVWRDGKIVSLRPEEIYESVEANA